MRPAQVLRRAAEYLERHGEESPVPTAERLLSHVLGTDRTETYAREGLTSQEAKLFGRALCRRCAGEPLQHVTGEQGFRRLRIGVRPGVFVPRPETEVLVQVVLDAAAEVASPVVVDVCTGSGAVALAIKDERPDAAVFAVDLSPEAVMLARENAAALGLEMTVVEGSLLDPLPPDLRGEVDVIACNPPYVASAQRDSLPPDVRAEPELAVFGRIDLYERLFAQAMACLRPGGFVAVEIEESTAASVSEAAERAGVQDLSVRRDLAGRDRVVCGRRPPLMTPPR
ncbi:MAG: peptide chain release factor N(5)-glutamine methyltransferase [Actinobacteria bacterium]|nr:peptide chain release factor N(5)-glutamine methyltransferase [Actinomycetota bacterium]